MRLIKKKTALLRSWGLMGLLALAMTGCQMQLTSTNPVTGRNEIAFISTEEEIEIGEEFFEALINESGGRHQDAALTAYVNEVGQKIAKVSDRPDLPYEFVVVNDTSLNAWALPGGKIAINIGLLALLENEAELAAILGHEIAHAAARHTAERWERYTVKPSLDLMQTMLNPTYAMVVATDLPEEIMESKYSRDAEHEADHYGMEYMARAGYDVASANTVHEKLRDAADSDPYEETMIDSFFNTHPDSENRVAKNKQHSIVYPEYGFRGEEVYRIKTATLRTPS